MADLEQLELLAKLLQKGMHKLSVCMVQPFPHAHWICHSGRRPGLSAALAALAGR